MATIEEREAAVEEKERELSDREDLIAKREKALGITHEPVEPLPADLVSKMTAMIRTWGQKGHPEKSNRLRAHLREQTRPPAELLSTGPVKPEKPIDNPDDIEIPPRNGKGATKDVWAEFAMNVADVEEEVVDRMGRGDIIAMLEAKGVIPEEGDEEDEEES